MDAFDDVLAELHLLSKPSHIEGMKRFGIIANNALGISVPELRAIAKKNRKNHSMALLLWQTAIHEARLLATMMDDPKQVTDLQMEQWVADFDSWDICDQCCGNLFDKTPFSFAKATAWTLYSAEYAKRAGFAMMAALAVHSKNSHDEQFVPFFELIIKYADDDRNFVKKAVNWALRQIGKRNISLNAHAITTAQLLLKTDTKSARWIATDALRELTSEAVQKRLTKKPS